MIKQIMIALVLSLVSMVAIGHAKAEDAPKYVDVLKTCGAEWKASDARKATPKGEGAAAWQTFRAECVKRHGYVAKRGGKAS